ncbi:aminoglycoside phosphotransferase family protein [Paenibacillus sp. PR3]|uniref:Aminoglycoside phosphotransferase family protein n=2 Tax=Paenibacillus terricola TaxID=2763503 RepID=A0ABR8MR63_9BACL|nr:aminoglycoside phosphotransferase family protein [Paenibacillus terricola]
MDIKLAEQLIEQWASDNADTLGLNREKIRVSYILNPGGFSNLSLRLSDEDKQLYVKLAPPYKAARLQQWADVSSYLTDHYTAPKLVQAIDHEVVPGYSYGLVFEYIKDATPLENTENPEAVLPRILETIAKLHHDDQLRSMLPTVNSVTYADAFEEEYINRLTEDLEGIRESRELLRDFVSDEMIAWFGDEIARLNAIVRQTPAFLLPAIDVVHNDLNGNNVLAYGRDGFRIIDWDDISGQGDAAMDYSVLLWPYKHDESWSIWREKNLTGSDAATLERLELYFRAKLLDEVIDVLADYIEAERVPEHREAFQNKAKSIHLRAYPQYLAQYGNG